MKCNICGKEFGNSVKCEHCGADRVAALGNYSGYIPSIVPNSVNNTQVFSESSVCNETKGTGFSVCYACGEVIPAEAKYCPKCAKKLYETCPKCGKTYSSQYTICQYCCADRIKYIEEQQRDAQEAEEYRLKLKQEQLDKENEMESMLNKSLWIIAILYIAYVFIVLGTDSKLGIYLLRSWRVGQ